MEAAPRPSIAEHRQNLLLDDVCAGYRDRILELPEMAEWTAAALQEPDEVEELEVEF